MVPANSRPCRWCKRPTANLGGLCRKCLKKKDRYASGSDSGAGIINGRQTKMFDTFWMKRGT